MKTKSYCQNCVYETHPKMLTTYLHSAGGQCDRCHRVADLAIIVPRPSEFELTVGSILESINRQRLAGSIFITGHADTDGTYHNFIMYQP